MANYATSASVNLTVNGKQAQKMLSTLQKEAKNLEKRLAEAEKVGNKADMKRLQRELKNTQKLIDMMRGSTASAESVLARLDKATPKELNSTLKTLQKQLEHIKRGSDAWNKQIEKIRQVRQALQQVNASMQTQQSMWSKMNVWLNNCQTAIMGVIAAVTGLVAAGRKAVNAYAEMDEALANTRKYTGLTEEKVIELNQAFNKIDTRTTREKLNELAQEAGRLGKNTLESVQGYVEAADIINVALVDLGSGATQTIAKLTNIFGVEQMLGTKKAMLAVGSTVNVLSQNCTASKPYLVEFAQRMAGIGSQAGLTIPQILAFGAVLDANGQKVEMSATAIQKVIMNLANKNHEFAATLGLDAEKLNKTLKHSAKDGLLMFLEALQNMGQSVGYENATMTLAPAFKEMGLDAARVSQVLSTLAMHLDEVKWQMGEADKAFKEASSATNEYTIFNNTAQAAIDKAKKRVSELAVELGEKLYPIMKHIYTSSGIFLRVLNAIVSFCINFRVVLVPLVVAVATYNAALLLQAIRTKAAAAANTVWAATIKGVHALMGPAKLALAGLTNAMQYFTNGMQVNLTMQLRWRKALAAMNFGNWATLAVAAIAAVTVAIKKLSGHTKTFQEYINNAIGVSQEYDEQVRKEIQTLDKLMGTLKGASKESQIYKDAKSELMNQFGKYIGWLIDEEGEIINLQKAYSMLTWRIKESAKARNMAKAEQFVEDEFNKNVGPLSKQFYQSLIDWGFNIRDAARISSEVISSLQTGSTISEETVEYLKQTNSTFGTRNRVAENGMPFNIFTSSQYFVRNNANKLLGWGDDNNYKSPFDIYVDMIAARGLRDTSLKELGKAKNQSDYDNKRQFIFMDDSTLHEMIVEAKKISESNKEGELIFDEKKEYTLPLGEKVYDAHHKKMMVSPDMAKKWLEAYLAEASIRGWDTSKYFHNDEEGYGRNRSFSGDTSGSGSVDKFQKEKDWREREQAKARINKATGKIDEYRYNKKMNWIDVEYYKKLLEHEKLSYQERITIQADYEEAKLKQEQYYNTLSVENENRRYNNVVAELKDFYANNLIDQRTYEDCLQDAEQYHWAIMKRITKKGSKEKAEAESKYNDTVIKMNERVQKRKEEAERELEKKYAELKKDHFGDNLAERTKLYEESLSYLDVVYQRELKAAADNEAEKLRITEAFEKAKLALRKKYALEAEDNEGNALSRAVDSSVEWLNGPGGKALTGTLDTLASGMSSIFSQMSSIVEAELQLQTASINKRYDAEISRAEGNSYQVARLEKKKEKEIAKAKSDANRKMFAMQVIQAVAQTAQNALNAYGSAAAIPVVGYILAPIAAAMAVAAGTLQIASIKKQQQASEAQGYAEGGFTPAGPRLKEVGVVHAGEWVASQKLVNNPRTRPILEALDYAQRTNTVGSLTPKSVSRSLAAQGAAHAGNTQSVTAAPVIIERPDNSESIRNLNKAVELLVSRLNQPFFTVNSVTGDFGMNKAKEEYELLMRNKSPKYHS